MIPSLFLFESRNYKEPTGQRLEHLKKDHSLQNSMPLADYDVKISLYDLDHYCAYIEQSTLEQGDNELK
jgi:hypothetical protein